MLERSDPANIAAMDARIAGIGDWHEKNAGAAASANPRGAAGVVETMKWKRPSNPASVSGSGHPGGGILCTGEAFKEKVKITLGRGAMLVDPSGLYNASLGGNAIRAIDLAKGKLVEPAAFKALKRAAATDQAAKRLDGKRGL